MSSDTDHVDLPADYHTSFVNDKEILSDADRFDILNTRLDRVDEKIDTVLKIASKVEAMVSKVVAEVKPTLDVLMNSPFLKMFGVKKP